MARATKRRLKPRKAKQQPVEGGSTAELNAAGRAQLGRDEEKRPYRPREDDASVEDPLKDWPESD